MKKEKQTMSTEQILTLLTQSPQRIAVLTADLPSAQLHTAPSPDEWSANDILAHLRACADIWGKCVATIIAEDRPTIRAINPRSWIKKTDYPKLEFHSSLRSYITQRTELMKVLEPLPPEGWSRTTTVTGAGAVLQRTVLFYAQWLARHERTHIPQFERLAKRVSK